MKSGILFLRRRAIRRRATTLVMVAVMAPVLIGFAALSVDVGAIYNARADLQTAADSAALAAASMMSGLSGPATVDEAFADARQEVDRLLGDNPVLGRVLQVSASDVVFGRASVNPNGGYDFTPSTSMPDAIRVTVRMTSDSPNGPLPLYFAPIFGKNSSELSASATAMMAPRDIAIVADLSASHNDDSELSACGDINVNMHAVWDGLPGGYDDMIGSTWSPSDIPPDWVEPGGDVPQAAGPAWGYFKKLGYGDIVTDPYYDPTSDSGLVRLPYRANWSDSNLEAALADQGYSSNEISAIMSKSYDSSGAYEYRVAVALGLAYWNSGMSGGLWESRGVSPSHTGNGNSNIQSSELEWTAKIMSQTLSDSDNIWLDYINNYMKSTSTSLYHSNSDFRYRYGVKTFVNYLLERRPSHSLTPELSETPHQPMQAVKDSVDFLTNLLDGAESNDQVSLEVYGTTARHEMDLTDDFLAVSNRLDELQAGYYDSSTNMGGGIEKGIAELESSRARTTARKAMILLTDGQANVNSYGGSSTSGGIQYALDAAQEAADHGIKIFTVAVGNSADIDVMEQIAQIGGGSAFRASGTIDEYSSQLEAIFLTIGGAKDVQLIQ